MIDRQGQFSHRLVLESRRIGMGLCWQTGRISTFRYQELG